MKNTYKTITRRGPNSVASHASEVMTSADGQRKAYGRYVKNSLGNGRFEIVQAWRLAMLVDKKWKTLRSGLDKSWADKFIAGEIDK